MISRFYFYSPVFLEYGLSETKHSVSSHIIHWIRGENTTCTLGIYYCFINFDSMCLAFRWNTVLSVCYKCSNKLILMYKKLRMQKQGGFHQITFHDLLINDFESNSIQDFYLVKFETHLIFYWSSRRDGRFLTISPFIIVLHALYM